MAFLEKYQKAFFSLLLGMIFFTLFWLRNAPNWISQLACILTFQQGDKIHQKDSKSRKMYKSSKCIRYNYDLITVYLLIYRTFLITRTLFWAIFVVLIQRTLQCFNITFVLNIRTIL